MLFTKVVDIRHKQITISNIKIMQDRSDKERSESNFGIAYGLAELDTEPI